MGMGDDVAGGQRTLGRALAAEIGRRGITQAEAARLLDTSEANVSRWIRQESSPEPPQHEPLMRFLRVTKVELALLILNSSTEQWERHRRP